MVCENCGLRQANVNITKIINGVKTEKHFCTECAEKQGLIMDFSFGMNDFLGEIIEGMNSFIGGSLIPPAKTITKCNTCGLEYSDFVNTGLLGCSDCYSNFSDRLEPIYQKLQGSKIHTGKVAGEKEKEQKPENKIKRLEKELKKAIEAEEYEVAAKLRDEIKFLKDNKEEGK